MQNTYGQDRINEKPPRKLSIRQLFNKIWDFVLPYKFMVLATLLLTLVGSLLAQVNAYILRYTVDELSSLIESHKTLNEGLSMLFLISGVLLAKELVYAAIQFGQKFYGEKLKILISRDFSGTIVERILSYRMAFYTATENESGKLQSRIDLGISSLTGLVRNFFIDILPLFANAFIALVIIFAANFWVGLVSLAILPVYYWVSVVQANRLSGYRRRMRYYRESRSNAIIGLIDSIPVIKSFTRESLEAEKHEKIQYEITENQLKTRRISFLFDSVKSFLEQVGVVFIIILTAYFVLKGDMSIGMILFHILLFNNVSAPIRQLHRIYDEINDALVYSEAFFNILDAEDEIENSGSIIPENITGNIEMTDVDFRYPNGTTALKEVSIHIPANKITALVGLSGAGKSTVVNLLDKFYKPTRGKITLDGTDLEDYDTARLRDQIGLVMQENHIFKGSITENILYGNQLATHEEVVEAAKKAHIHQEIMELPKGYDSNANQLSGGQKQRISIARLFLKDPPIIFLDEPTASLDAVATEQIKKSLDAIKKDRTVIIISHSISQIIDADNVVVLDHGRVVEKGPHEALYKNEAAYYDIFQAAANSLNLEKISDTLND